MVRGRFGDFENDTGNNKGNEDGNNKGNEDDTGKGNVHANYI